MLKDSITRIQNQQNIKRSTSKLNQVVKKSQLELSITEQKENSSGITLKQTKQQNQIRDQAFIDSFESIQNTQSKSYSALKHFKVNRILVRWQQMQRHQNPSCVRDTEQPKFGDLRKDSKQKINLLNTNSETSSNSQAVSPPSCYVFKNPKSFSQFAIASISGELLSLENKIKSQEILKMKQIKNFNCRPIKSTEGIKFDKAQSSLLQKRKKDSVLQNKRNLKAIIQANLEAKDEKNDKQNNQLKQTIQIQEDDLKKTNQALSQQYTKQSKDCDQQFNIEQDITSNETGQGSALNSGILKEILILWNQLKNTLSKTTSCKSEC